MHKFRLVAPFLILLSGIGVGVYFLNQSSGFELRKKAAPAAPSSRLYFKGPSQVKIGEQFPVDVYLDTTNDPQYTISGVDARIAIANDLTISTSTSAGAPPPQTMPQYLPSNVLTLMRITPSPNFDSYPGLSDMPQQIASEKSVPQAGTQGLPAPTPYPTTISRPAIGNLTTISGVKNYAVDDKGRFKGFTGTGVVATLTFTAERPGKATLQFVYTSPTATDDTNVTGFLADQPASLQKPQERLVMAPEPFSVNVVAAVTPTPPPVSPTCVPEPPCAYEGVPDKNGVRVYCSTQPLPLGQTYCPRPTRTPTPRPQTPTPPQGCRYEARPCAQPVGGVATDCGMELVCLTPTPTRPTTPTPLPPTPTPTVSPTPTPTPTPEPRVMINFRLALEDRKSHATVVDIYGMTTTNTKPNPELVRIMQINPNDAVLQANRMDKLGTAITDPSGTGTLSLERTYAGATYILFAQTPSHLRKAAQNYQAIRIDVGQNPVCRAEICTQEVKYVDFGILTAGDVYTDEKGNKDNLINTFDVGAVFASWSSADVVAKPRDQSTFGGILPKEIGQTTDLNGDGVVNNRDLAMLLSNFNKRGDTSIQSRPLPVTSTAPQ